MNPLAAMNASTVGRGHAHGKRPQNGTTAGSGVQAPKAGMLTPPGGPYGWKSSNAGSNAGLGKRRAWRRVRPVAWSIVPPSKAPGTTRHPMFNSKSCAAVRTEGHQWSSKTMIPPGRTILRRKYRSTSNVRPFRGLRWIDDDVQRSPCTDGNQRFADRERGAAVGQANLNDCLDTLGDQQVAKASPKPGPARTSNRSAPSRRRTSDHGRRCCACRSLMALPSSRRARRWGWHQPRHTGRGRRRPPAGRPIAARGGHPCGAGQGAAPEVAGHGGHPGTATDPAPDGTAAGLGGHAGKP
jgi:hypothetical protein